MLTLTTRSPVCSRTCAWTRPGGARPTGRKSSCGPVAAGPTSNGPCAESPSRTHILFALRSVRHVQIFGAASRRTCGGRGPGRRADPGARDTREPGRRGVAAGLEVPEGDAAHRDLQPDGDG